jgi:hypothetical protein
MRNIIPKLKKINIIKEGVLMDSGNKASENEDDHDGRITLIKSDHPSFTYEVYDYKSGVFRGYMGNRKKTEERKDELENIK